MFESFENWNLIVKVLSLGNSAGPRFFALLRADSVGIVLGAAAIPAEREGFPNIGVYTAGLSSTAEGVWRRVAGHACRPSNRDASDDEYDPDDEHDSGEDNQDDIQIIWAPHKGDYDDNNVQAHPPDWDQSPGDPFVDSDEPQPGP
ncbi:hypothetical protein PG996_007709 [Apiospora saccharicola]|uniref:Uncharacterized protein n=1 Tax=Apiospora saccharicola TaxID=335842 RepID=A0ABR1VBM0_9PEZI